MSPMCEPYRFDGCAEQFALARGHVVVSRAAFRISTFSVKRAARLDVFWNGGGSCAAPFPLRTAEAQLAAPHRLCHDPGGWFQCPPAETKASELFEGYVGTIPISQIV